MPNWTFNRVRVRGDDSKTIQELKELFEGENPFNALIPEPDWTVTPLSELHENNSILTNAASSQSVAISWQQSFNQTLP